MADDQLLSRLASIVQRRNQITAEFLVYLAELDERQLFLDLGYSSLFEYCVEKLGLCESTAGRHIAAVRVCRNYPQVFAMVASGALHASALSLLRKHLTAENADELLRLCSRRSARKVEELLVARFPRPDVCDLIRRLPVLDHIDPLGMGGEDTIENLRLRCRAHNQRYARQFFGASRVNAAIRKSRRRKARPALRRTRKPSDEGTKRSRLEP